MSNEVNEWVENIENTSVEMLVLNPPSPGKPLFEDLPAATSWKVGEKKQSQPGLARHGSRRGHHIINPTFLLFL